MDAATPPTQAPDAETVVFSAVLRPHRSLGPRGFGLLMTSIALCSFFIGFAFWLMGAWPVVGFCGLDVLLIQLAFRLNYRDARACEEVHLTRERLSITQISPRGAGAGDRLQPLLGAARGRAPAGHRRHRAQHRLARRPAGDRRLPAAGRARELRRRLLRRARQGAHRGSLTPRQSLAGSCKNRVGAAAASAYIGSILRTGETAMDLAIMTRPDRRRATASRPPRPRCRTTRSSAAPSPISPGAGASSPRWSASPTMSG